MSFTYPMCRCPDLGSVSMLVYPVVTVWPRPWHIVHHMFLLSTVVHYSSPPPSPPSVCPQCQSTRLIVMDVNYPSIVPGISMLFLLAGNPGSFFKNGSLTVGHCSNYCTISTDRSHLVMRDAHSSLTLMFTTSGDA